MPKKFFLTLIGSLIVVFSLGTSTVRADWVIDSSGTLVEVNALALQSTPITIAAEFSFEPTAQQRALEQRRQEAYEHYQELLASRDQHRQPPQRQRGESNEDYQTRLAEWKTEQQQLQDEADAAGEIYQNHEEQLQTFREQTQAQIEEQRLATETKREELRAQHEQAVEARRLALEQRRQAIQSKLEVRDNKLEVVQETVDDQGEVVSTKRTPLPPEEKVRIEKPDKPDKPILLSPDERDHSIVIEDIEGKVRTRTNFPISIGEDNQLKITKRDGTTKEVTVLPSAAVEKIEQKGFVPREARLTESEHTDDLVYEINGIVHSRNVLGINMRFQTDAEISARTGEIVREVLTPDTPWLQRMIGRVFFGFGRPDQTEDTEQSEQT